VSESAGSPQAAPCAQRARHYHDDINHDDERATNDDDNNAGTASWQTVRARSAREGIGQLGREDLLHQRGNLFGIEGLEEHQPPHHDRADERVGEQLGI